MNQFAQIRAALGPPPGGPWRIGDDPPLAVSYNPGTQSLIFSLNSGVHITIYQSSWDGVARIADCTGGDVDVGPFCLHTTAGAQRWFRQRVDGSWSWVTDCDAPTRRYLLAFDAMMNTMAPYLGVERRRPRRRPGIAGGPEVNRIAIGPITSCNPTLWVNLLTVGQDPTEYVIATSSPGDDFMYVNQFCSILSIRWLQGGRGRVPYGIGDFSDPEKRAMAETLIGYTGMDDQIAYAEDQLGGLRRSLEEVSIGMTQGGYRAGTQIWAGNDFHVIGLHVTSPTEYELYDSNTGLVTLLPRAGFAALMERLHCDAFVVAPA